MPRLLVLVVFLAVALDFSTPDAVLLVANTRALPSDDEEEDTVPSRRQRVGESEQRVVVFQVAPGSIEKVEILPSAERRAHAARISRDKIWRVPFRQALMSSVRSASSPDAH